jgi:hypothetical protein
MVGEFAKQNKALPLSGIMGCKCGGYMGRRLLFLPGEVCDSLRRRHERVLKRRRQKSAEAIVPLREEGEGPNIKASCGNGKIRAPATKAAKSQNRKGEAALPVGSKDGIRR